MKLIVGLGNPGARYAAHRHNVGFRAVDRLVGRAGLGAWRARFQGLVSAGEIGAEKVLVLKPETYMNESGRAVGEAARFLKVTTADIIVLHDELDLGPGRVKVKRGGGNAGHNGLRSITAHLDNEYTRVRIGIGHPGVKELVQHWVLSDFAKRDADWLDPLLDALADAMPHLVAGAPDRFLADATGPQADPSKAKPDLTPRRSGVPSRDDAKTEGTPRGNSPAGESANKRATALADNLKRWMQRRKPKD